LKNLTAFFEDLILVVIDAGKLAGSCLKTEGIKASMSPTSSILWNGALGQLLLNKERAASHLPFPF
jgi:hypothetical protein